MNGVSKIDRWLKGRGYDAEHLSSDYYRYYDSFHKGDIYLVDAYKVSNGLYVLVKAEGKPRYILSKNSELSGHILIDFSQGHFINKILPVVVGGNPLHLGRWEEPCKSVAINLGFLCTFV